MKRQGTPAGDDAAQEGCFREINAGIKAERSLGVAEAGGAEVYLVSVLELTKLRIPELVLQADTVPGKHFEEVNSIDGGELVETVD